VQTGPGSNEAQSVCNHWLEANSVAKVGLPSAGLLPCRELVAGGVQTSNC
jgi:hypothetical protein